VLGPYKTNVIRRQGSWRSLDDVEFAALAWARWFNTTRHRETLGYLSSGDCEAQHYETVTPLAMQAVVRGPSEPRLLRT